MDFRKKIDNFAKGREEIRLLIYIVLLPVIVPWMLIEYLRDTRSKFDFVISLLLFCLAFFISTHVFRELADKYIQGHFVPQTISLLPSGNDLMQKGWLVIYGRDLSNLISSSWSALLLLFFLIIILLITIIRGNKYRKLLLNTKLIKDNRLDRFLFGGTDQE